MRYLNQLQSFKPSGEHFNAVLVAIALTFAMLVTAILSSLVFLAMPYFTLAGFILTVLVGLAIGFALIFIIARTQTGPRFEMLRKIAIVEGFVALALLPINAGTTFAMILLLLVAVSYAFAMTALCMRWIQRQQDPKG